MRQQKYDFDESVLKPYLPLERISEAVFECAQRLYGLRFVPRPDVVAYHPDVKVKSTILFLHNITKCHICGSWSVELLSRLEFLFLFLKTCL